MIVVADTSPLLHLARIGRLELIRDVVGRVVAPQTVWSELSATSEIQEAVSHASSTWIDVRPDPVMIDLGLDPGETAAILLAEQLGADALLIDERRGRAVATARGLSVIGTVGIVAGARRRGYI